MLEHAPYFNQQAYCLPLTQNSARAFLNVPVCQKITRPQMPSEMLSALPGQFAWWQQLPAP